MGFRIFEILRDKIKEAGQHLEDAIKQFTPDNIEDAIKTEINKVETYFKTGSTTQVQPTKQEVVTIAMSETAKKLYDQMIAAGADSRTAVVLANEMVKESAAKGGLTINEAIPYLIGTIGLVMLLRQNRTRK